MRRRLKASESLDELLDDSGFEFTIQPYRIV
jgi:hypothetical protein